MNRQKSIEIATLIMDLAFRFNNLKCRFNTPQLMSRLSAILFVSLVLCLSVAPKIAAGREQVNSQWTQAPPTVDGVFTKGEWLNPQIVMTPPTYPLKAHAYFQNDAFNLYVLVDSVGDETDAAYRGDQDECLLIFNFENSRPVQIVGYGGAKLDTYYFAAIGFNASPNSPSSHKIYEFRIPLEHIRATPGQQIDFCSPEKRGRSISYDATTGADNIWPVRLVDSNKETWGILAIAQAPQVTYSTVPTTISTATTRSSTETTVSTIKSPTEMNATYLILGVIIVLVFAILAISRKRALSVTKAF